MNLLINPVEELIERYTAEGKLNAIDPVARDKAIAEINKKMEEFAIKERGYF